MSGKITAQVPHLPSRSRTRRRDNVPALAEPRRTPRALRSTSPDVLESLTKALKNLAAGRTVLVDLSEEQVVRYSESLLADMLSTAFPGVEASEAVEGLSFKKVQVGVYAVRARGTVTIHPFMDLPNLRSAMASHLKHVALKVEFVAQMRLTSDGRSHGNLSVACIHFDTITALKAREAAIQGKVEPVADLASLVLGLHHSKQWTEALSTALLGSWTEPLLSDTGNSRSAMKRLKTEARIIHSQLTPLWRHETSGSRLLLLDAPMGKYTSLYDLVAVGSDGEPTSFYDGPDDARLGALLRALQPEERVVMLARACPGVASWEEAALLAGATDPVAMGKRVRRKVDRLRTRQKARAAAAARQQSARAAHDSPRLASGPESGGRGE
ncbi:hypothetical protein [Streptomyces dioscori]|uniref:hypothetical protein n=1 Tax=Streptomyces dioscori TaxID=2109333 RepID=UPI00131E6F55|nr:hypothetical protein [Streptomyces dioscori]